MLAGVFEQNLKGHPDQLAFYILVQLIWSWAKKMKQCAGLNSVKYLGCLE